MSVVLHRRAAFHAGARGVPEGGRGRGRLPLLPARPVHAGGADADEGVSGASVRPSGRRDAFAGERERPGRGDRDGVGPGGRGEHAHGASAPAPGRGGVRRDATARAGRETVRGVLHSWRQHRRPRAADRARRIGRDGRGSGPGLSRLGRGARGDEGSIGRGAAAWDPGGADVRLRGEVRRTGRAVCIDVPPGARGGRAADGPGGR